MTLKTNRLRDAISIALIAGATTLAASGTASAQEQSSGSSSAPSTLDAIQVTGSRIKRADIEGPLPVVVMDRTAIEASGDISVADFLRDTSFNTFGSYQSTSGSSGAGFSGISLRGLGESRTVILVDGRRAPTAPMRGQGQDLNSIPLAAVERIEVLPSGASAIYGSDAIGGVVNIITRKDYEGVEVTYGVGRPTNEGGDTEEMSVLFGAAGERGRVLGGASYSERDIIYTRDRDYWYSRPGTSTYSNNFATGTSFGSGTRLRHPTFGAAVPGLCTNGDDSDLFYTTGTTAANTQCQYNHAAASANLTSTSQQAVFFNGDYQINEDWIAYFNTSVTKSEAKGRYAPVPSSPFPGGAIRLVAGSPNHPSTAPGAGGLNPNWADPYYQSFAGQDLFLFHRFAALGNRDSISENTTSSFLGGLEGSVGGVDLDVGARYVQSRATDIGMNYVVGGLAQAPITSGEYNIYDPFAGDAQALGFTASILRDMKTSTKEVYANANFDLFELPGGTAAAAVGAEYREEYYQDNYDPLSSSGQIVGSAGNSASGGRDVYSGYVEILFPIVDSFEVDLAGRYERYSDYGSDFAPMVSASWKPLDNLKIRANYGEGFRAPTLDILTQQPAFSAASTSHRPTCESLVGSPTCSTQVTTYSISNPGLVSEQSEQWGLGAIWDANDWLSVGLDYYNIKLTNQISSFAVTTIANCLSGIQVDNCPPGISVFPANSSANAPNVGLGLGVEFGPDGEILYGQTGYANQGQTTTSGYDLTVRTNFDLGAMGSLRNNLMATYVADIAGTNGVNYSGRPGYPRLRANLSNVWSFSDFDFQWNISYIHHTQSFTYRDWLGDANSGSPAGVSFDEYSEGLVGKTMASYITHDLQLNYKAPWNATITLGVRNIADRSPTRDYYYEFYGSNTVDTELYDPWGRVPYFRYTQRF